MHPIVEDDIQYPASGRPRWSAFGEHGASLDLSTNAFNEAPAYFLFELRYFGLHTNPSSIK
jgi:hypothetical protein